jgi:hypothetical protein
MSTHQAYLHGVNTDSPAFVPAWQKSLYLSLEEIGVQDLYVGGDSLLHVNVCYKSRTSQLFFKGSKQMEINGRGIENLSLMAHNLTAIVQ